MSYKRREFLTSTGRPRRRPLLTSLAARRSPKHRPASSASRSSGSAASPPTRSRPRCRRRAIAGLAGIVTGTPAKAEEWKKKYGIPDKSVYDYKTMNRMADNKDIDIVYVVTPNALHLEHALAAAAAGKHVFCEKPMEISVERCQQMVDAVRRPASC
jgi:predicted dehydrogenase